MPKKLPRLAGLPPLNCPMENVSMDLQVTSQMYNVVRMVFGHPQSNSYYFTDCKALCKQEG